MKNASYYKKRSELIMSRVATFRELPTLSVVVGGIADKLKSPYCTRAEVANLLKKDQVLTARVLRMVNSGFFARSTQINNVEKALHFLGDHTVLALVMGTSVFSQDDLGARDWFDVQDFWMHCLATAIASEFIALHVGLEDPEEAFTSGLLHDLGKVALFRADRSTMKEVIDLTHRESMSFMEAEQELGLPGHHLVGERMSAQWSLPLVVRKVQRYHHRNVLPFSSIEEEQKKVIMVVTLADAMAKRCELGFSGDSIHPRYNEEYLKELSLSPTFLEVLEHRLPIETLKARELLIRRDMGRRAA